MAEPPVYGDGAAVGIAGGSYPFPERPRFRAVGSEPGATTWIRRMLAGSRAWLTAEEQIHSKQVAKRSTTLELCGICDLYTFGLLTVCMRRVSL
jgi:hypothetical protein